MTPALCAAVALSVVLYFVPDAAARLVGLCAEIAFLLFFPVYMEGDFNKWQEANPAATPANGWIAIGWGFVGIAMFIVVAVVVSLALAFLLPGR